MEIRNITKTYGEKKALDSVGFSAEEGKITVILGPSGSGKSTLLKIIAGLEKADEGEIVLADKNITDVPAGERGIAMVFQDAALFPMTNVKENILYGTHLAKTEAEGKLRELSEILKIESLLERYPRRLSGGERQRVNIARALIRDPEAVLLDEPFASLDEKLKKELQEEVMILQKKKQMTVLWVTHDQKEAFLAADQMIILREGRLIAKGTPEEIRNSPDLQVKEFITV